jgi:hypothetical protein
MLVQSIEKILDKFIQTLKDDTIKKKIEILLIQPLFQYLIELLMPYLIILCVVFVLLILMIVSILYLLIFQEKGV